MIARLTIPPVSDSAANKIRSGCHSHPEFPGAGMRKQSWQLCVTVPLQALVHGVRAAKFASKSWPEAADVMLCCER